MEFFEKHWGEILFGQYGLSEWLMHTITFIIDFFMLFVATLLVDQIIKRILMSGIASIVKKTKAKWDDYLFEQKVFRTLAHLPSAMVFKFIVPLSFNDFPLAIPYLNKLVNIYIIYTIVLLIYKVLKSLVNFANNSPKWKDRPVKTFVQVLQIIIIFLGLIFIISTLVGTKPGTILGALAGTTAILILIFQDSITGLLANFQISMYDLVKVGDWITFKKYGVDGDVISIDLTTVKVQNFDKTISTVPAKSFVNDSFVNWRGMVQTDARRIKRNLFIDVSSVKYLSEKDLAELEKINLLGDFVRKRQSEIAKFNSENEFDTSLLINGRQQTNLGLFRKYIYEYLVWHPEISNVHTIMTRQLQPTTEGIPLEVYCFTRTIVWKDYENIQSDVFDHILVAASYFGLELFQNPTGSDFTLLKNS